ncbi:protein NOI4-like isoform X1 [Zingiber officinale]|uniref:protein NOI4-like isoform X1 n=1 Tax=Zingiber officinale TaxID=94328 RepID=UPI001C4D2C8B|nr:protein NOI4-like isoform X1 [Zingiber officinale]
MISYQVSDLMLFESTCRGLCLQNNCYASGLHISSFLSENSFHHEEMNHTQEKGCPLPKFGEWDVNDPASAEGFTVIFNKARDEKKMGGNIRETDSPGKEEEALKPGISASKPPKKWFCCMHTSAH